MKTYAIATVAAASVAGGVVLAFHVGREVGAMEGRLGKDLSECLASVAAATQWIDSVAEAARRG